jgi:hypothetical protein
MMETVSISALGMSSDLTLSVLSALALAVQMIDKATQGKNGSPLKYDRRIIIVTDGRGVIDTADLDQIAAKIKDANAPIEVVLLGVDFDDAESGYKEEDKDDQKVTRASMRPHDNANVLPGQERGGSERLRGRVSRRLRYTCCRR